MDSLPTFAKILVAVDGSDHAEKAFRHAMALAQKFGSKVVIANVTLPPVSWGGMGHFQISETVKATIDSSEYLVKKFSSIAKQEFGITAESVTAKGGAIADEILKAAESSKADLIVIESRGLTGFKEMVLGSVSIAMVHRAKVPVLTVK